MKVVIGSAIILLAVLVIGVSVIPKNNEPLTELYFDDHTNLPKEAEINKEYNFSFTVHNLEYKKMLYDYEITLEYDNKKFLVIRGTLELENEETQQIKSGFTIKQEFERAKITVNIVNKKQAIHFWVNK